MASLIVPSAVAAQESDGLQSSTGEHFGPKEGHEDGFTPEPGFDNSDDWPGESTDPPATVDSDIARFSAEVLALIQDSSELSNAFVDNVRASGADAQRTNIRYSDDITVPSHGDGSFNIALNETQTLGLQLEGSTGQAEVLGDWGLHYSGDVSSIVTFPSEAILETFTVVSSGQDPQYYSFLLEIPGEYRLVQADDLAVAVVDGDGFPVLFVDARRTPPVVASDRS